MKLSQLVHKDKGMADHVRQNLEADLAREKDWDKNRNDQKQD